MVRLSKRKLAGSKRNKKGIVQVPTFGSDCKLTRNNFKMDKSIGRVEISDCFPLLGRRTTF